MKIFSAKQIYEADRSTMEKQQLSGEALMERASLQLFSWLHKRLEGAPVTIRLFCGIGNNGGDGMALARHLMEHGYQIVVYVVNYSQKRSEDFLVNLDRLKDRKIWPEFISQDSSLPQVSSEDILIDAIFGIGLNRSPDPWVEKLMQHLNASGAFILSVDVPSGLYVDQDRDHEAVICANRVLSFQAPKLVFFLPESGVYSEHWEVLDIGLDPGYLQETGTVYELIGREEAIPLYRPRKKFTHKGSYGHALIIGGSHGKMGAVQLASKACLRVGSGLATAYVPRCGYLPLQTALAEVMVLTDKGENAISAIQYEIHPDAVGIGIGLGTREATITAFSGFLDKHKGPLVVDADALNILAKKKALLRKLPSKSILTPHPKELQRLIGPWEGDFHKLKKAMEFAAAYDLILHIKGAHSITIYDGHGYINDSGNPGMATAGSGDVLTGIITGLMAQGYAPLEATVLGAYLHGLAGDAAAEKFGYESLVASDLIEALGLAFLKLLNKETPTSEAAEQNS